MARVRERLAKMHALVGGRAAAATGSGSGEGGGRRGGRDDEVAFTSEIVGRRAVTSAKGGESVVGKAVTETMVLLRWKPYDM